MGDGVMATFGTPVPNPLHADMAFESALKIKRKVEELGKDGTIPLIKIGLGLHCGDVITGNIGNEIRKQYSISGSPVILAFRIEQLNKEFDSEFLITKAVLDRITPGKIQINPLGHQTMRGFDYALEVFKVIV
jgi:adenylate cyclase